MRVVRRGGRLLVRGGLRRFLSCGIDRALRPDDFDCLVVGGGHAGCEAAAASCRVGARTCLVTFSKSSIGAMSCNPSFGGIGKGHLMIEVDALDGLCARLCDTTGVQYKILNRSKGEAVWGYRAQIDRTLYREAMQAELASTSGLHILEASVDDLIIEKARVKGVILSDGSRVHARCVVLATGTFLHGEIFCGTEKRIAGRLDDHSSTLLADTLARCGFTTSRLKTGTPPRLNRNSIDFSRLDRVDGDPEPKAFSFMTDRLSIDPAQQLPSFLTHTNEKVADIVRETLHLNEHVKSESIGSTAAPAFCPSIESKILKFDKSSHQVFLEPEGWRSDLIYPQGLSCTMPPEDQIRLVRGISGLERAEVVVPGYGVSYDFINPLHALRRSLETKMLGGLYFAGQINGTTGYEEAAAQGIVAGINAGRAAVGDEPAISLSKTESYIGLLVDELTRRGTDEPYRMFTCRSEYRCLLRPDNADERLTLKYSQPDSSGFGISADRYEKAAQKYEIVSRARYLMQGVAHSSARWAKFLNKPDFASSSRKMNAFKLFGSWRQFSIDRLKPVIDNDEFSSLIDKNRPWLEEKLRIDAKYEPVIENLYLYDLKAFERFADLLIPGEIDYSGVAGLSNDCRRMLSEARPLSVAEASEVPGVTPSAVMALALAIQRHQTVAAV